MQDDRRLSSTIKNVSFTALAYCHFSLQNKSTDISNQLRMQSNSNASRKKNTLVTRSVVQTGAQGLHVLFASVLILPYSRKIRNI